MRKSRLNDMLGGWFVGNFEPTFLKTEAVEVAVKRYAAGESTVRHYHKVATEITAVITGEVTINGKHYYADDLIAMDPGEIADFTALTDAVTVVVKIPGMLNDKYLADPPC